VQGIYKDVVLGQPTCGHCDEFTSTLPRQTTSLYHGPVVINLPGRPGSWGIARPENLFRPGGTHFISHSICSIPLPLSASTCHHRSLYYLINSSSISHFFSLCVLFCITNYTFTQLPHSCRLRSDADIFYMYAGLHQQRLCFA